MGNDPSKQTIENINSNISSTILKALQKSQTNSSLQQQVTGKCGVGRIKSLSKGYTDCIVRLIDKYEPDSVLNICSLYSESCKMNDIDLKAIINVKAIKNQDANSIQEIKTNITNTITQTSGTQIDQLVSNINDNISEVVSIIIQELKTDNNISQELDLDEVKGEYISMKTTLDTISNVVQKNKIISENVSKITNIISQTSLNDNSTIQTMIYTSIVILIAGFLISVIMTLKRSNGISDFFYRILPVIIFFVLASIITIIHVLTKPSYISFKDKDGIDVINKQKLLLYMALYYFIIVIIIVIVNKFITIKK
jgi:hypothetical protein